MEIHQLGAIPVNIAYDPLKESGAAATDDQAETIAIEKEKEFAQAVKSAQIKRGLLIGGAIVGAGILFYLYKKSK